jgi:hypothetical protein
MEGREWGGGGGGCGVKGLELEIMTRVHLLKVVICLNRRECPKINAIVNCAGKSTKTHPSKIVDLL